MTQARCPSCNELLESDEDLLGCDVACPNCGHEFTVKKLATDSSRKVVHKSSGKANRNAYFGSFMLGFAFSFIGIFIAHMIDGRDGARAALRGMLLELLGGAVLLVILKAL